MRKLVLILVFITIFSLVASPVKAQEADQALVVDFSRDFGYGGFGGDIQGRFSLKVSSPANLVRVEYYLDDELVFEVSQPPFLWQFNTANYPEGRHTFRAVGFRADGSVVQSAPFTRIFLTSEQAWSKTGEMLVPILVLVGVVTLAGALGSTLWGRKKQHVPGVYGMAGGAICPQCTFPYARSLMAPNLLVGKLSRCPHCGKWAIVPAASPGALAAAEERLAAENQGEIRVEPEGEKLRQRMDESRFED